MRSPGVPLFFTTNPRRFECVAGHDMDSVSGAIDQLDRVEWFHPHAIPRALGPSGNPRRNAYQCPWCEWHISSGSVTVPE